MKVYLFFVNIRLKNNFFKILLLNLKKLKKKLKKMQKDKKETYYQEAVDELKSILEGETDLILKMSTINSVLKNKFDYYYWVGFYIVNKLNNKNILNVGPYQGTFGCLHIDFNSGVCGRAAREQQTQVVQNVHNDTEHIACDSNSNSEIVLPVFNNHKKLIAVFDIDSTELSAFDEIDKIYLEKILTEHFENGESSIYWNLDND